MSPNPRWPWWQPRPFETNLLFIMGYLWRSSQNFESKLIADLCRLMGTKKLRTSLHHPQTNGQCERFNSTLIGMLRTLPPDHKSDWKGSIGVLVQAYNCTQNSTTGFSLYFLMYGRQPQPSIDITLGLTPNFIAAPTSTRYIQKLGGHVGWAHKKADLFQQKEAWSHKQNFDRCSKAVALRAGDMVLVHITAFKSQHKIQNRWKNRKYVVEWQPYPNLPVYVIHPMDGEGCSQTMHKNYLLPINNNLEQAENENPVEGVEPIGEPTPVPQAPNELPADGLTISWPESLHSLPPKQHKLVNPRLTGSAAPDCSQQMKDPRLARTSLLH